ncbi:hypothetical protein BSIN_0990 [Burkholderia singularis]|uniref:Uncharacterized protein n=1 Tax=Burkholderia singularis TaxID=1503053 RepID=A0A238HBL6_9BURK|nr:hypothetical protein BSIN_0990 [Burkholderia singularis]
MVLRLAAAKPDGGGHDGAPRAKRRRGALEERLAGRAC